MKKWQASILICYLIAIILPVQATHAAAGTTKFPDVPATHWAASAIEQIASKKLIGGYPDGTFRPSGTITRAEYVSILARIAELPPQTSSDFTDIENHWASGAIQSAAAVGIITKADFGASFEPNKAITRIEMARMIGRELGMEESYKDYLAAFKGLYQGDLPLVDYKSFKQTDLPLIGMAFGAGIIKGYPDSSFGSDKNATRAEAAAMFLSLLNARTQKPESFQALRELKEVAETGMNAEAVSNLEPVMNLKTDGPVIVEHANFTAKLKRLYVVPLEGDTVSIYERKFLWDRNLMDARYRTLHGYVMAVVEITFKKNASAESYTNYLYLSPRVPFGYDEPSFKFDFYTEYKWINISFEKGEPFEAVLYGRFDNTVDEVGLQTNDAQSGGWYQLLINPDKGK